MGAVTPAQLFFQIVTRATTNPPMAPTPINGKTTSRVLPRTNRPQVHAAVATTQISSTPALLTVPWMVITSPAASKPVKVFAFSAGFDVLSRLAMLGSLLDFDYGMIRFPQHPLRSPIRCPENLAYSFFRLRAESGGGEMGLTFCSGANRLRERYGAARHEFVKIG